MSEFEHTQRPDFWEAKYRDEATPWDLARAHPTLRAVLELGLFGTDQRVFVPGAGMGHDALLLAEYGHRVVSADFARQAVARLRAEAIRRRLDSRLDARHSDIFDLEREPAASFDAVFEYTCLCAIDPDLRPRYRDLVTHLVRPGGSLVMLAFPLQAIGPVGPPHVVRIDELRQLFAPGWQWLFDIRPRMTPEPRSDTERLAVWRRTPVT